MIPYAVELHSPYGRVTIEDHCVSAVVENGAFGMVIGYGTQDEGKLAVAFAEGRVVIELPEHWLTIA